MTRNDFIELLAAELMEEMRDDYPIVWDYDDNTFAWLEKGREIAKKLWPSAKWMMEQDKKP